MQHLLLMLLALARVGSVEDERAIRAIGPELSSRWNRGDAKACAALWTEEGSLVTPDGTRVDGRDQIEQLFARDFEKLFKGSRGQYTVQVIDWFKPDAAFVDMELALSGLTRPGGKPGRDQTVQMVASIVKQRGRWLLANVRSFVLLPPPARSGSGTHQQLKLIARSLLLPGADGKPVLMDYLAADRSSGRVWVPAGETGSVDVIDVQSGSIARIDGFPTLEQDLLGSRWKLGPSSAAIGSEVVYVGNRGDSKICIIDAKTLKRERCISVGPASGGLASSPDALVFVASTKELWVTMGAPPLGIPPKRTEIAVFDAPSPRALRLKDRIPVPGAPEGYAVDERRGIFYTNLEEDNRSVGISVRTHAIVSNWSAGCGREGPRGLAVDEERNFLFVACTDRIVTLDPGHGGAKLSVTEAGAGIDNIDYVGSRKQLYVAAGKAAVLTLFHVDDAGVLTKVGSAPTAKGARVVVADAAGTAYVADSSGGRILQFQTQSAGAD
jgi:uncharacterized protein (TIGR02246 family)